MNREEAVEKVIEELVQSCPFVDKCDLQCTPAGQSNCWELVARNITIALFPEKVTALSDGDGEYFDNLLQEMICEVPQLRRLWTWKDDGETLQDNIKLGIVFDLLEHLHKHYQATIDKNKEV